MKYLKSFEKIYNDRNVKVGDIIKLVSDPEFETVTQIGEVEYVHEIGIILKLIFEYYDNKFIPNDEVCGDRIYPGFKLLNGYGRELTEQEQTYLNQKKYNL